MQRVRSALPRNSEASAERKLSNIKEEHRIKESSGYEKQNLLRFNSASQRQQQEKKIDPFTNIPRHNDNPDNHNKLSKKRINFDYEVYGYYPDDNFKPSVFFFKFLAMKIGHHSEKKKKLQASTKSRKNDNKYDDDEDESNIYHNLDVSSKYKLKLNLPNTIILNDVDSKLWMYTDSEGNVRKKSIFNDTDIINTFKANSDDLNEIYAVSKTPIIDDRVIGNHIELLNKEELESCLSSKNASNTLLI